MDGNLHFQIVSDIHLETPKARPTYQSFPITSRAPNLVLLGDIGERVFFVLGNHESYGLSREEAIIRIKKFEAYHTSEVANKTHHGIFILLEQTRFDIDATTTILGCTLFSNIADSQRQSVAMFVNDFSEIQEWSIDAHNSAHGTNLKWLNDQVEAISKQEPYRRILIFSHYRPTFQPQANDPRHLQGAMEVRTAFVSDLSKQIAWKSRQVKLWAFGHTHFNCDFIDTITKKRVLANQKGYARTTSMTFNADLVVSTDAQTAGVPPESNKRRDRQARVKELGCIIQ